MGLSALMATPGGHYLREDKILTYIYTFLYQKSHAKLSALMATPGGHHWRVDRIHTLVKSSLCTDSHPGWPSLEGEQNSRI
jgi:hypothetical protein